MITSAEKNKAPTKESVPKAQANEPSSTTVNNEISFQLFTRPLVGTSAAQAAAGEPSPNQLGATHAAPTMNAVQPSLRSATRVARSPEPGAPPLTSNQVIVEDGEPVGPGQISRTQFMELISGEIERVAGEELAAVGRTADDCPYIAHWLNFYRRQSALRIERAIQRYARPERSDLTTVQTAITSRVRMAVQVWIRTGGREVQAPEGVSWLGTDDGIPDSAGALQALAVEGAGNRQPLTSDPAAVQARLTAGHALDGGVRTRMESAFGQSFSGVRLHTDGVASQLASSFSARAFTVGNHIAFAAGQYKPGTLSSDAITAHELAHVLQQRGPNGVADRSSNGNEASAPLEHDADRAATHAIARTTFAPDELAEHINAHPPETQTTGLRLQRCGDDIDFSQLATKPDYELTLKTLEELYALKEEISKGERDISELEAVNARIAEEIDKLRVLGINLDEDEIHRRVTAVFHPPGEKPMRTVGGLIVRTPPGPAFIGQRLTFQFAPNYLPSESNVKVEWHYKATDDKIYGGGPMHGGTILIAGAPENVGMSVTLAERFWTKRSQKPFIEQIEKAGGFTPIAVVTVAGERVEIVGDFVPLASQPPRFGIEIVPAVPMPNTHATLRITDWAPVRGRYVVVWEYDGKNLGPGLLKEDVPVGSAGSHTIRGKLYRSQGPFGDEPFMTVGDPIGSAVKTVEVRERQAIGEQVLADSSKIQTPPKLSELEASIKTSMQEIAKRGVLGGDREAYWQERYKAQQERLEKLGELVPDYKETKELPEDPASLDASSSYASAIPAVIVYGGVEGTQPISVYLTARKSGNEWSARLVDMTGAKVVKFDGKGATALAAFNGAFATWKADNPYPTGGLVVYNFSPPGWTFPKSFSTTTAWKTAKEWVDGLLSAGAIVVGALLLLAPEATITKVVGLALIALGTARAGVGIYERLELGYELLDKENVIDGIVIVTSLLGLGGGVLRGIGAEARALGSAPLVYRVGNWMVVTTLAADVGTLIYLTDDALTQLRAARGDPTMDESQRSEQVMRVISSLLVQGIMIFVSNRDLFRGGLHASDFVKMRLPETETVSLSKGMRLDVELEMRKAGADPSTVKRMDERELLSNFLLVQRRQQAIKGVDKLRSTLSEDAQIEFDAARLRHDSIESFKTSVEKHADPKQHFEGVAAAKKKAAAAGTTHTPPATPPATPPSAMAVHIDRLQSLHPESQLKPAKERALVPRAEGSGFIAGPDALVRVNGQVDVHPTKLAAMSDGDVKLLLESTHKLADKKGMIADVDAATKKDLETLSSRHRFRFEYQLKDADTFLADMGLKDKGIFKDISDFDRARIYDVTRADVPAGTKNLKALAAHYADKRKPATPRAWANHFEFFMAEFKSRGRTAMAEFEARVAKAVADWEAANGKPAAKKDLDRIKQEQTKKEFGTKGIKEGIYEKLEADLTESGDPTKLSSSARSSIGVVYDDMVKSLAGRTGAISVKPGLPDADLIAAVKAAPEVRFGSPDAAAYHALKHSLEMPPSEMGADIMKSYLNITQDTIKNPTRDPNVTVLSNGARSIGFLREVKNKTTGVTHEVSAIVIVSPEGNVVVASVQARIKK